MCARPDFTTVLGYRNRSCAFESVVADTDQIEVDQVENFDERLLARFRQALMSG